ncbi:MAG: copper resistance protein B [Thermomonas sp.]
MIKLLLPLAIVAALALPTAAHAQHAGHDMTMPMPAPAKPVAKKKPAEAVKPAASKSKPAAKTKPAAKAATAPKPKKPVMKIAPPADAVEPAIDHSKMDHSKMEGMDHSQMQGMDHSKMEAMDHSTMEGMDHSKMDHSNMGPGTGTLVTPIPPITEADRQAAFPDLHTHHLHGTSINSFWMLDRLEVSDADPGTALGWEGMAWIGGDVQRIWLRTEGEAVSGRVEHGDVEVLYGRGVRAWWDVVAGVRHDIGEGPSRTWGAFGVQGLAPYKFEVAATAYVGQGGRTAARVEAEYDTLFTNRLILQWRAEANAYGKSDPLAGIGSGLSTLEAGLRLRYEVTRQFAPYVGIEHERAFGNTADLRRVGGHGAGDTRVVAGVRVWF